MHVILKKAIKEFWDREPAAKVELAAWYKEAKAAAWATPADVKAKYGNASILRAGRVVFNIRGNKYRLIVQIRFWTEKRDGTIFIRFVGTHAEYDEIDARTI